MGLSGLHPSSLSSSNNTLIASRLPSFLLLLRTSGFRTNLCFSRDSKEASKKQDLLSISVSQRSGVSKTKPVMKWSLVEDVYSNRLWVHIKFFYEKHMKKDFNVVSLNLHRFFFLSLILALSIECCRNDVFLQANSEVGIKLIPLISCSAWWRLMSPTTTVANAIFKTPKKIMNGVLLRYFML